MSPSPRKKPASKPGKAPRPAAAKPDYLARVREICFAFSGVVEKEAWGAPTFRIEGGKMFAMFAHDHHGDGRVALWCLAPAGAQQMLVAADPEHYFVPPYVGCYGWLGIRLDRELDSQTISDLVEEAHREAAAGLRAKASKRVGRKKTK